MTSTINVPLLRKAIEWAEEQNNLGSEGHWYQDYWIGSASCGTTYCIAGYVGQLLEEAYTSKEYAYSTSLTHPEFADDNEYGTNVHVSLYSANALGLDPRQARELFDFGNGIDDLKTLFKKFTREEL